MEPRRGAVAGLACFAAGLLMTSALLHGAFEARLPARETQIAPGKLALLERMGPVDVVFVGTSRVDTDIDPRVVDEGLGAAGLPLRSFNLGVPALTVVEEQRLVVRLGSLGRPPRTVVVEPVLHANAELYNVSTDRVIASHDAAATRLQLDYVASTEARPLRKLRFASLHVLAFAYDGFNVGKGPRLLAGAPDRDAPLDPGARGFGRPGAGLAPDDAHRTLMVSGEAFRMLRAASRFDSSGASLSEAQTAVLRRVLQAVRGMGAVPILLLPPRFDWDAEDGRTVINRSAVHRFLRTRARELPEVPILRYDDPNQTPELYEPGLWFDSNHLNAEGARIFSERLGRDLTSLLVARD